MSLKFDSNNMIGVNSVLARFAINMISVFFFAVVMVFVHVSHTVFLVDAVERREDNSSHNKLLLKAELFVQAFWSLVLMADDNEGLVASLDDQVGEILCQIDSITKM